MIFYTFAQHDKGSSGSPILNISTNKLIGIHKGTSNNHNYNKGCLLFYPFKEFISLKIKPTKMVLKNNLDIIYQSSIKGSSMNRIIKEIINCNNVQYEEFQLFGFIDDKVYGVLEGLPNTPFENGFFQFTMIYTDDYPFKPPKLYFKTPMFHPNIDENGLINLKMLQNEWSPSSLISKIIYSVQLVLDEPKPNGIAFLYADELYKKDKNEYEKIVREYTAKYANFDTVQNELKKMNFEMKLNNYNSV